MHSGELIFQDEDIGDVDTDNLLVEIDSLTKKVLRETSLWNLQERLKLSYLQNSNRKIFRSNDSVVIWLKSVYDSRQS